MGVAGLAAVRPAAAIDILDERKVREKGFDLIYEARELDLPQAVRDGLVQVRSLPLTEARVSLCLSEAFLACKPIAIFSQPRCCMLKF